jgi:hypothetical protein
MPTRSSAAGRFAQRMWLSISTKAVTIRRLWGVAKAALGCVRVGNNDLCSRRRWVESCTSVGKELFLPKFPRVRPNFHRAAFPASLRRNLPCSAVLA